MRIIAGKYGGRRLEAPKGDSTRPTTDRVRESVMSSLANRGFLEDSNVLDAFAGSGALGFESLSRGCAHAVFCDSSKKVVDVIRRNAEKLTLSQCDFRVLNRDILKSGFPAVRDFGIFDIVFLDPPYSYDASKIIEMIEGAIEDGSVSDGCIFVYEHDSSSDLDVDRELKCRHDLASSRKNYGLTSVDYIHSASSDF